MGWPGRNAGGTLFRVVREVESIGEPTISGAGVTMARWDAERVVRGWAGVALLFVAGCVLAVVVPHDRGIPYPWHGAPAAHPVGDAVLNAIGLLLLAGTVVLAVCSALLLARRASASRGN